MHKLINKTPDNFDTDHINRNGLDNRRKNLRIATRRANKINANTYKNNTSGIKGVYWHKRDKIWHVYISAYKKLVFIGYYKKIENAIKARKRAEYEFNYQAY